MKKILALIIILLLVNVVAAQTAYTDSNSLTNTISQDMNVESTNQTSSDASKDDGTTSGEVIVGTDTTTGNTDVTLKVVDTTEPNIGGSQVTVSSGVVPVTLLNKRLIAQQTIKAIKRGEIDLVKLRKIQQPIYLKPQVKYVEIGNESLMEKGVTTEPTLSIDIEVAPNKIGKLKVVNQPELKRLEIGSEKAKAFTKEELEVKNFKLYLVESPEQKLEVRILPDVASEKIRRIEPQEIESMELKTINNKPVYKIKSVQKIKAMGADVEVNISSEIDATTGDLRGIKKQILIRRGDEVIEEKEDELVIVDNNQVSTLKDMDPVKKIVIRNKLLADSVKPLVNIKVINEVREPKLIRERYKFVLQLKKGGYLPGGIEILRRIPTDDYDFVVVKTTLDEVNDIIEEDDVVKVGDEENIEGFVEEAEEILAVESEEKIRELGLEETTDDVSTVEELEIYLSGEEWEAKEGQTSRYQGFVTPDEDAVEEAIGGLSKEEIYNKVRSFVWMSDYVLTKQTEKWLTPKEFLEETPDMEYNPLPGEIASDCSEQANTLVSMLRASGVKPEDVRVVLGEVDFGMGPGGHAWVEIKEDDKWMVLDATSGNYYDDAVEERMSREGVPFDYWKYHEYPAVGVWMYYNDKYFTDQKEEVASGWSERAGTFIKDDILDGFEENLLVMIIDFLKGLFGR